MLGKYQGKKKTVTSQKLSKRTNRPIFRLAVDENLSVKKVKVRIEPLLIVILSNEMCKTQDVQTKKNSI